MSALYLIEVQDTLDYYIRADSPQQALKEAYNQYSEVGTPMSLEDFLQISSAERLHK